MLGRIPFEFPVDKLRDRILKLCEMGHIEISSLVLNTLRILGTSSEGSTGVQRTLGNSNNNLLYLLTKMHRHRKFELIESTKRHITLFKDSERVQMVVNLLRIPPSDGIFQTALTILTQCAMQLKYSLLIELIKTHSIVKTLINYLKFGAVCSNITVLLRFFLLGYHDSLSVFHEHVPEFESQLVKSVKTPLSSAEFPQMLVELLIMLMKKFPGYPELYGKLVELIKEVILKYHIQIMPEEKFEAIIQASSWSNIGQKPLAPKNALGYKGLVNLGNSTVTANAIACYMNSILQALFFSVRFRQDVLRLDQDSYLLGCNSCNAGATLKDKMMALFASPLMQLQKVFALLMGSLRSYITPKEFRNTLPDYFRTSFMQQDASEFFKVLSDLLELDAKRLSPANGENVFSRHFESKIKRRTTCNDCKRVVTMEDKFVDLFIPIDRPDNEP
eukprot:TRINITY_DN4351_c0_g1_i5.p1 TRINITY_DN4351_c0_g1~~TRINITY_DN4351_c0_g1_i5.p1  ORF type:complete len:446 (+),score=129.98 TRINITY_DN4351_c0_g1_i5:2189-3526(+)